jgi:hypothetical protein
MKAGINTRIQNAERSIEEEAKRKGDRADGYGQLIDENEDDRLDSAGGDEETKLIE